MRILAIRGRNLASLAETFEIDLTASPLGDAGLFAITGDTGAGKSTILDALCLALYNNYPRVAVRSDEKAPDPSGMALASGDARAILRRGAAQGHAEVDFVGRDGRTYRARWETRRARAKADGRPQKVERQLLCLDDQTTIAASVTEVHDAVVIATGLTFDQFRRTVLLAQGEFDAFLLANENERAELLEKITGTEIYAEISKRVYANTKQRTEMLAKLADRRTMIGGLDDAARASLIDARDQQATSLANQLAHQAALTTRISDAERIATLRTAVDRATTDVATAGTALKQAADDQRALAVLDAVEPLRPLYEACKRADAQVPLTAQRREHVIGLRSEAERAAAVTASALNDRHMVAAAADQLVEKFSPVWREAERLDTQVASAHHETAQAVAIRQAATAIAAAALTDRTAISQQHAALAVAHARSTAALAATAAHALLNQQAAPLADLLGQRTALTQQRATTAATVTAAQTKQLRLTASLSVTELRRCTDLKACGQIAAELTRHRAALLAADELTVIAHERHFQSVGEALHQVLWVAEDFAATATILSTSQTDATAAAALQTAADARLNAATVEHASAQAARDQLTALVDLADATASQAAVQLRSRLVPEQPCPVCGADAHPYAHGSNADSALVAEIRRQRAALDRRIASAGAALSQAQSDIADATGRQRQATRLTASATADQATQNATFIALVGKLAALVKPDDLPQPLPTALTPTTAATCSAQLEAVTARRHNLATARTTIDDTRAICELLQSKLDRIASAVAALTRDIDSARAGVATAQQSLAASTATLAGLSQQISTVNGALTPYLDAAGLSHDELSTDGGDLARTLAGLGDAHRRLTADHAALVATLADLTPQQARAVSRHDAAVAAVTAAEQTRQARAATLAHTDATRAALLDGEPTAAHRDRHLDAQAVATVSFETTRAAAAQATVALAALTARAQDAEAAAVAAVAEADRMRTDFNAAVADIDGAAAATDRLATVQRALATPPATVAALRGKLDALTRRLADATTALDTRRTDMADAISRASSVGVAADPDADLASLKAAAQTLAADIATLHGDLAAHAEKLRRDDEDRLRSAALNAEITTAAADLEVWRDVDAAIGSAQGDKFRRFAQSITLDQLVRLANGQLTAINPRFHLVRSATSDLGLHMMDRDLGDDTRSIRSLSGGERFLVSLALALALSGLEGRQSFVDTLFIDEGFGSLDADTLDTAISALETLQSQGRKVGVITHVAAMIDRIAVAIRVEKRGPGRSVVRLDDGLRGTFNERFTI